MPYAHKEGHRIVGGTGSQERAERMMIHDQEQRWEANLEAY